MCFTWHAHVGPVPCHLGLAFLVSGPYLAFRGQARLWLEVRGQAAGWQLLVPRSPRSEYCSLRLRKATLKGSSSDPATPAWAAVKTQAAWLLRLVR